MLAIEFAVSTINKYASSASGDTVEIVERPHGGFTALLVDGQGSGRAAKLLSTLVARAVMPLIKDGVRDGVAARAAHDYLYLHRSGKVSATLALCSVDLVSRTLVLTRNSHCPFAVYTAAAGLAWLDEAAQPIGLYPGTRPVIREIPLLADTWAVTFSDGLLETGRRAGLPWDVRAALAALLPPVAPAATPRSVAAALLAAALAADQGRPQDDMSVLVVALRPTPDPSLIRTLDLRAPLDL